jgi:hypothetical protein
MIGWLFFLLVLWGCGGVEKMVWYVIPYTYMMVYTGEMI